MYACSLMFTSIDGQHYFRRPLGPPVCKSCSTPLSCLIAPSLERTSESELGRSMQRRVPKKMEEGD
jgi:hypothetical protein